MPIMSNYQKVGKYIQSFTCDSENYTALVKIRVIDGDL